MTAIFNTPAGIDHIDAKASAHAIAFVEALRPHAKRQYSEDFGIQAGKRYDRITSITHGEARSVHAFIDRESGDVLKAAGWKAPAKGPRGNVATPEGLAEVIGRAAESSRYLYL